MGKNAKKKRAKRRQQSKTDFTASKNNIAVNSIEIESLPPETHLILSTMVKQQGVFKGLPFKYIKPYFEKNSEEGRSQTAHRIANTNNLTGKELETITPLVEKIDWAISYKNLLEKFGLVKEYTALEDALFKAQKKIQKFEKDRPTSLNTDSFKALKKTFDDASNEITQSQAKYLGPVIAELQAEHATRKQETKRKIENQRILNMTG